MADEERAAGGNRAAGLDAARAAFYRGDIAQAIVTYHRENGGLLTADDLASFKVGVEPPERVTIEGIDVYACGPWCQGPTLLQALQLARHEGAGGTRSQQPGSPAHDGRGAETGLRGPRTLDRRPALRRRADGGAALRRLHRPAPRSHSAGRGVARDAAGGRSPWRRGGRGPGASGRRRGGAGRGRARHVLRLHDRRARATSSPRPRAISPSIRR